MSTTDPYSRAVSSYQHQEIVNESPIGLIARVFEMALLDLKRARSAVAGRDFSTKARAVHQVSRCLSLLQCSLDLERGGEVATNLDRLYDYLQRRLSEAHATNDDAIFGEIGRHLGELGAAWREVSRRGLQGSQAAGTVAGTASAGALAGAR